MKKKSTINENEFALGNGRGTPYQIYRAPEPVYNADGKLKNDWLIRRQKEQEANMVRQQVVAEMDNIEPMIVDLYNNITNVRNFVDSCRKKPFVSDEHRKTLVSIRNIFDKMNNAIVHNVIAKLDTLGITRSDFKP